MVVHHRIYNKYKKKYIFLVLLDKERKFDKERNSVLMTRKFDIVFSC